MQQIIDGIIYDTTRATQLCSRDCYPRSGDGPVHQIVTLWRGSGGRYFKTFEYPQDKSLLARLIGWGDHSYIFPATEKQAAEFAYECGANVLELAPHMPVEA